MNAEYDRKILLYRTAMAMAKSMLSRGIISEGDYIKIDKKMTEKYAVNSCSIYR